nr:universal stress protein [Limobrevibacterium gyesilva]
MVPDHAPATLGEHVALAWRPGPPAEHAAEAALPLLERAARVFVLIATIHGEASHPPGILLRDLDHAGIPHVVHRFEPEGSLGVALAREAAALGADLLVMGAFGHSRMRELLLGGATHDILAGVALPVLLRH